MPRAIRSWTLSFVAVALILGSGGAAAQGASPDSARARDAAGARTGGALRAFVWVNTAQRVYHCPGSRFYGTTRSGEFMSEGAARALGNRAAAGNGCPRASSPTPPPTPRTAGDVWVNTATRVYHCPGSAEYARTERGRFLTEVAARRAGHRPARGNRCG